MAASIQKTIFITGSRGGIGRATAILLAQKGNRVIATTHKESDAVELNRFAKQEGLSLESFALDVNSASDRKKILDFDIDVLINNAGIGETGSLAEIEMEKVRNNFEVNVFGPLELTQLALRSMIKKDRGSIIFISSLLGRVTSPFFGPYSMSKFALSSGAEMLRKELSQISEHIHVSVVEPGPYSTGFNQKMMSTKFQWMNQKSYFYKILSKIKKSEALMFKLSEQKNLTSIVNKILGLVEADKPKFRAVAPWWQGLGVQFLRTLGK